jgi:FkbM family methyltransferase
MLNCYAEVREKDDFISNWFIDLGTHYLDYEAPGNVGKAISGLSYFQQNGFFGQTSWKVRTYEASPRIYQDNLRSIPKFKSMFFEFEAFNLAITGNSGMVIFSELFSNPSGSNCVGKSFSRHESAAPQLKKKDIYVYVPSKSLKEVLDEVIAQDNEAKVYLKIDIEGSEYSALKSILHRTDLMQKIQVIYVEWHHRFWKNQIFEYLKRLMFKLLFISYCYLFRIRVKSHW